MPTKTFKKTMRPVRPEELRTYDYEENRMLLFSDRSHRFLGGPLLYEANIQRQDIPVADALFTMKTQDMIHEKSGTYLFSLHKIYMSCSDPTEYQVAQKLFNSYKLWQAFVASVIVEPHIDDLREELDLKLKSEAMAALRETMLTEGSKGTTAAKYLAEMKKAQGQQAESGSNSEKYKGRSAAGLQPSQAQLEDGFEEDIARLQLVPKTKEA